MIHSTLLFFLALQLRAPMPAAPEPASRQTANCDTGSVPQPRMVLVPAGSFEMGTAARPGEADIDNPSHSVRVDAFYLDATPVTNADYFRFCQSTGHRLPFFWGMREFRSGLDWPGHPVVGVSHDDAQAYAEWLGLRLPSEAEWEWAARGGLSGKSYPNGDDLKPEDAPFAPGAKGPERVAQFPPNGYGLYDMAGNAAQWVMDYYDKDYYRHSTAKNPKGPETGRFHVIRGGGWYAGKSCNRVYYRNALPANWVDFNVGFRCAKDGPAAAPDAR